MVVLIVIFVRSVSLLLGIWKQQEKGWEMGNARS